jgi:putative endopeptidase
MKKLVFGILVLALVYGCTNTVKKSSEEPKKYPPFDVKNMDTSVKPGDDFYTYAIGTWLKNNPIPADKNLRSSFDELIEKNRHDIRAIIEEAAATKDVQPGSNTDKIGTFYNSGMDTLSIEKMSITPLKLFFDKIASIKNINDIQSVGAFFQTYQISPFFYLFSNQDSKNSTSVIAQCYQT